MTDVTRYPCCEHCTWPGGHVGLKNRHREPCDRFKCPGSIPIPNDAGVVSQ